MAKAKKKVAKKASKKTSGKAVAAKTGADGKLNRAAAIRAEIAKGGENSEIAERLRNDGYETVKNSDVAWYKWKGQQTAA